MTTVAVDEDLVCEQISNSFIIKGHQPLKENDIGWTNILRLFESGVLNERILRNGNRLVRFYKTNKSLIGHIEVQSVRMVEIVFSYVY